MRNEIQDVRQETRQEFQQVRQEIQGVRQGFYLLVGTMITMTGVILAAVKL